MIITWTDVARLYDPALTDDQVADLLWADTAYPFSGIRTTARQLHSAIRARKHHVPRCELCGMKPPFHRGCYSP